jgi:hypothetical protein
MRNIRFGDLSAELEQHWKMHHHSSLESTPHELDYSELNITIAVNLLQVTNQAQQLEVSVYISVEVVESI